MDYGMFLLGVLALTLGSDSFLRGVIGLRAGSVASTMGLTAFSAIAFGTSIPDLVVNVDAAQRASTTLAFGNILGSSVNNIGLLLGGAALLAPLTIRTSIFKVLLPIAVLAAVLVWVLGFMGNDITRGEGIALLGVGFIAYLVVLAHLARSAEQVRNLFADAVPTQEGLARNLLRVAMGTVILLFGARWCVDSGMNLAKAWNWNPYLVGLTVMAIGTSIPQLIATLIAAKFDRGDFVVTGVLGSTIFNLLILLGAVAILNPVAVSNSALQVELPAVIAFIALLYPMMRGDAEVSKREGGILLLAYALLVVFQVWVART